MATEQGQGASRSKELFGLPPKERRLVAIRAVNELTVTAVTIDNPAWPIELKGNQRQTIALLDLLYQTTPPGQLGVIVEGVGGSNKLGLHADKELSQNLNQNEGIIPTQNLSGKEGSILYITEPSRDEFVSRFGYSAKGTDLVIGWRGRISVNLNNEPSTIADESLMYLYKLTGNPNYIGILGTRIEMKGRDVEAARGQYIDRAGYYAALGLNPYALRFLDEKLFERLVKGMKREVVKATHPDVASNSPADDDYLKKMLEACEVLENSRRRAVYSRWLGMPEESEEAPDTEAGWQEL